MKKFKCSFKDDSNYEGYEKTIEGIFPDSVAAEFVDYTFWDNGCEPPIEDERTVIVEQLPDGPISVFKVSGEPSINWHADEVAPT